MPFAAWDWVSISAFLAVAGVVLGALGGLFRMSMARSFVSHADHTLTRGRITDLETRLAATATRIDLDRIEARMGPLETGVAVLRAEVQAVKDATYRTEHMVQLLLNHQLNAESGSGQ